MAVAPLHGFDVYSGNGTVNWTEAADGGQTLVYIKATEGVSYSQTGYFTENKPKAQAAGLKVGGYHYFRANDDGNQQAEYFLSIADVQKGDLLPVVDLETTAGESVSTVLSQLNTWLETVEKSVGQKPMIYVSSGFWSQLGNPSGYSEYPLWVAEYTTASQPKLPEGWVTYALWQHSQTGTVTGASGDIDLDVLNGGETALMAIRV